MREKIYGEDAPELHGVAAHGAGSSPARRLDSLCEVYSTETLCKRNANRQSPKLSALLTTDIKVSNSTEALTVRRWLAP